MKKLLVISFVSVVACFLVLSTGCSKKDPGDALFSHMTTIFKLVKDNMDDCDKAAKAVTDYTADNKGELEKLAAKLNEMDKNMSDEEKKKYEEKMGKKAEAMMKEAASMMSFHQKCPEQAKSLQEAMAFMEAIK
jgi:hypothetical protein